MCPKSVSKFFLFTIYYCWKLIKCDQMQSNEAKCKALLLMYAVRWPDHIFSASLVLDTDIVASEIEKKSWKYLRQRSLYQREWPQNFSALAQKKSLKSLYFDGTRNKIVSQVHCPRAGLGWVEAFFTGPDPGPQGRATLSLALGPWYLVASWFFFSNPVILIFWLTFMYC